MPRHILRHKIRMRTDMFTHERLFFCCESTPLCEHQHGTAIRVEWPIGHHDEIAGRIRYAEPMQGVHSDRDYAYCLARFSELPASNGYHSIRLKVFEVLFECLHCVEIVFAERERSRSGRSPRIHQRHLQYIVS